MARITDIAEALKGLKWASGRGETLPELLGSPGEAEVKTWPMGEDLNKLLGNQTVGPHIGGVVANVNAMIANTFSPVLADDPRCDDPVADQLKALHRFCLQQEDRSNLNSVLRTPGDLAAAQTFLRVAALYHDIGKIIGNDRHVSRGVHLMRDVNDEDREAFEQGLMEGRFEDKHNFWTVLSHHDIFGCLCTGEAALPALSQMVSWAGGPSIVEPHRSPAAVISYLLVLNLADMDSSLRFLIKGLRTVEAKRYLEDWQTVVSLLWDSGLRRSKEISRETFKEALLNIAGHPERAIERVVRIVTTSYRMNMPNELLLDESEVKKLVEDELDMLHGARLEMFCYLLARFCKIDYGRRFFDAIMLFTLLEHRLLVRTDGSKDFEDPDPKARSHVPRPTEQRWTDELWDKELTRRRSACLQEMTRHVCSILKRIVDDYGDSVAGDRRSAPLMCIVMANVMPNNDSKTAWPICRALKEHESRALAWISEEVAVSPYGG